MTLTYRKLPGLVEAQLVPDTSGVSTTAELTEVAIWSGGTIQFYIDAEKRSASLIKIPTLEGPLLAFAGDYIVKDGERVTIESPEAFAAQYVAAE